VNLRPLLNRLKIQDRDTGLVLPWEINWAQDEFIAEFHNQWNANRPVRIIVLKARQLGISTATQALGFTLGFVMPDTQNLTVAHEMDSSEHLLTMSRRYWDTFDFKELYTPRYASRKHMEWVETGSSIKVITAKNEQAGRGRTIRFMHGSEVAFWENAEILMLGLEQTVPVFKETAIVLESTANGIGNYFYDTWNAAVQGDIDYVPMFFPWWKHPQYHSAHINLQPAEPPFDAEEKSLAALIPADEYKERLGWRRWAIRNLAGNDIHRFHQEYPSTPEEAFVSTGLNVFPVQKLAGVYEKKTGRPGRLVRDTSVRNGVRFQDDITGPLTIYRWPSDNEEWGVYMVGGDPTHTTRGDYACAQVINRRNYEQVAIWRGRVDPMSFAEELAKLGMYYNQAVIASESTGPGYGTIGRLVQMNYPKLYRATWADKNPGAVAQVYGWNTTFKSKEWAIGHLLKLIVDEEISIHDSHTFTELRDYVTLPQGGYGPASDRGHDDTVMSLAIACIASATEPPVDPFGQNPVTPLLPNKRATETQALDPDYWESVINGGT
jgi:hypothetical protein